eukprot:SAG31_NODE_506_length_14749_cov_8.119181_8_plen_191_part_00
MKRLYRSRETLQCKIFSASAIFLKNDITNSPTLSHDNLANFLCMAIATTERTRPSRDSPPLAWPGRVGHRVGAAQGHRCQRRGRRRAVSSCLKQVDHQKAVAPQHLLGHASTLPDYFPQRVERYKTKYLFEFRRVGKPERSVLATVVYGQRHVRGGQVHECEVGVEASALSAVAGAIASQSVSSQPSHGQ